MAEDQASGTQTTTATPTPRFITVVTTRGEKRRIPFEGNSWKDLKDLLQGGGKDVDGNSFTRYDLSNMKCVEGINKTTLEHPDAKVPEGNFNLFLMPYKSKSGGPARDQVKKLAAENKEAVKAHFGNWTTKKEEELATLLPSYTGTKPVEDEKKEDKPKDKKGIGKVVSNVVESKAKATSKLDYHQVLEAALSLNISDQTKLVSQLQKVTLPDEDRKKQEMQEKKKQREEEDRKADEELQKLARGFNDVRL
jgi:hypothetical protein